MPVKYSSFQIPSYARSEAYNFDADKESFEIYQELNSIAEEIEKCRLRNC
jgi:hypothetical protein